MATRLVGSVDQGHCLACWRERTAPPCLRQPTRLRPNDCPVKWTLFWSWSGFPNQAVNNCRLMQKTEQYTQSVLPLVTGTGIWVTQPITFHCFSMKHKHLQMEDSGQWIRTLTGFSSALENIMCASAESTQYHWCTPATSYTWFSDTFPVRPSDNTPWLLCSDTKWKETKQIENWGAILLIFCCAYGSVNAIHGQVVPSRKGKAVLFPGSYAIMWCRCVVFY